MTGYRTLLVQRARAHAEDMARYDDTKDLVDTLVEMAIELERDTDETEQRPGLSGPTQTAEKHETPSKACIMCGR